MVASKKILVDPAPKVWLIVAILTIGLLSYSSGAIFVRLAVLDTDSQKFGFSLFLSASRLMLASFFMIPAWQGFRSAKYSKSLLYCSGIAGLCLAVNFATWITSLSYTSIAASTSLSNTHPVWIALFSWFFFKEKFEKVSAIGVGIAISGILLIGFWQDSSLAYSNTSLIGNFLALTGGLAVCFYILLGKKAQCSGVSTRHHTVLVYCTAGLLLLPLPLLYDISYLGHSKRVYLCIFSMALIPQIIGHTSFSWAMRWVKPIPLSLVFLGEPFVASILGWVVFQEIPAVNVLVGSLLVIAGATVTIFNQKALVA
jgi:drug/metabolite transporter (DMT)-like permease